MLVLIYCFKILSCSFQYLAIIIELVLLYFLNSVSQDCFCQIKLLIFHLAVELLVQLVPWFEHHAIGFILTCQLILV